MSASSRLTSLERRQRSRRRSRYSVSSSIRSTLSPICVAQRSSIRWALTTPSDACQRFSLTFPSASRVTPSLRPSRSISSTNASTLNCGMFRLAIDLSRIFSFVASVPLSSRVIAGAEIAKRIRRRAWGGCNRRPIRRRGRRPLPKGAGEGPRDRDSHRLVSPGYSRLEVFVTKHARLPRPRAPRGSHRRGRKRMTRRVRPRPARCRRRLRR